MREFLLWWVGIEAVGLAAFPLTYAFFRRLPDRGFAFSKVIGLLLLGDGVWAGAARLPALRLALYGVCGGAVLRGAGRRDIHPLVRASDRMGREALRVRLP